MKYRRTNLHPIFPGIPLALFAAVLTVSCSAFCFSGDVWQDATLLRDEWGIPHVYANTPFAMAFVFGYAQAEDHCEHMLLAYRMANGKLAEILGEAYADSDAFSLKMGHARLAREALPVLDPVTRDICEGFSMGVNSWIADHIAAVPPWAGGVSPEDILAFWHAFLMSMAPFELPGVYRPPPALPGANAWAVSPQRNNESKAILVLNPHQQHDGFFLWYEAHLVLGTINLYGATLRGLPVIVQGHNERLGWALSPNQSDFADMFREEYTPAERNPKVVQQPGGGKEQEQHALLLHYMANSVPYRVRVGDGMETRYIPALIGVRGPMFEHPELGLHSWYIGGYRDFGGLRQLLEMGAATTLDQFTAALSLHQIPCFHILYADQAGNIFYLYNTKSGVRIAQQTDQDGGKEPVQQYQWAQPLSYSVASIAWRAVFSPDALPYIFNPPSGFVQACGNPPWTATAPNVLAPAAWPDWLVLDRDSFRAKRLRHLLHTGQRSFRDHQSILFDVLVPGALELVPALMRAAEARPDLVQAMHPDFQVGIQLLQDWNYTAELSSDGMTFFHVWLTFCRSRISQQSVTEEAFMTGAVQGAPEAQTILLKAVEDAARTMRNEYGTLEKSWGDVHVIRRGSREEPMPGALSGEPLFVASDQYYEQGKWIATHGYGFAMVVQFGETAESVSLMPFGQSQVSGTAHYDDQLDLLMERRFKHVRFLHDDILRNAERALGKNITLFPPGVAGAVTLHSKEIIHARLTTAVDAPHPLPLGLAPFTLYLHPERKPPGVPVVIEASLHVPQVLCDDAVFQNLSIYRYEPGLGWNRAALQHRDLQSRILTMRDDAPAECYVVLGPAAAAGETMASTDSSAPAATGNETQVGLDALLSEHDAQPVISGRGRLFHLERHDTELMDEPETKNTQVTGEQKGTFKLERLDESSTETKTDPPPVLPDIPGYTFGPSVHPEEDPPLREQGPIQPDEHSTNSADSSPSDQETMPVEPQKTDPVTPTSTTVPNNTESDNENPAPTPSTPDVPRNRPPLPDTIPQDPGFIFGPSMENGAQNNTTTGQKRLFNIERVE